ncbi:MAG: DUF4375 domain-containing protein [Oceanospirillaceae bacterium]|nr:DUF4375 domain-containing protein [Oceanospirillaceae bacterium]MCP5349547.1 DUF4375 domain-containing protein [Oceanospirillaceae bacterium]
MNLDIQAALDLPDETDAFLQISDILFEKHSAVGYDGLTQSEKVFYCIDGFVRGMGNGGISQFFYDEAGVHASDAVLAFEAVKAGKIKQLLEQALACFPDTSIPADDDARDDLVSSLEENYSEEWSAMTDVFFQNEAELIKATLAYVGKNLKNFS